MKQLILITAMALSTAAYAGGGWGNPPAPTPPTQGQGQLQEQAQGQLQDQGQSQRASAGAAAFSGSYSTSGVKNSGNSRNTQTNAGNNSRNVASNGGNTQTNTGNNSSNTASNAAQGNSTNVSETTTIPREAATAYGAELTASNGTCMGSSSGGIQGAIGVSFGSTWTDKGCDARYDAVALLALGERDAAVARLCLKPEIAESMKNAGHPCPTAPGDKRVSLVDKTALQAYVAHGGADPVTLTRLAKE